MNYLFQGNFQVSIRLLQIPSRRKTEEKFSCDDALKTKDFFTLLNQPCFQLEGLLSNKSCFTVPTLLIIMRSRQSTLRKEAFCHVYLKNVITIQRDIPVENVPALYAFPFSSVRFIHGTLRKEVFFA